MGKVLTVMYYFTNITTFYWPHLHIMLNADIRSDPFTQFGCYMITSTILPLVVISLSMLLYCACSTAGKHLAKMHFMWTHRRIFWYMIIMYISAIFPSAIPIIIGIYGEYTERKWLLLMVSSVCIANIPSLLLPMFITAGKIQRDNMIIPIP